MEEKKKCIGSIEMFSGRMNSETREKNAQNFHLLQFRRDEIKKTQDFVSRGSQFPATPMENEEQLIDFIDHLERSKDHQVMKRRKSELIESFSFLLQKIDEILKENEEKFVHWSSKPLQNERIEQLKQVWSNLRSICN